MLTSWVRITKDQSSSNIMCIQGVSRKRRGRGKNTKTITLNYASKHHFGFRWNKENSRGTENKFKAEIKLRGGRSGLGEREIVSSWESGLLRLCHRLSCVLISLCLPRGNWGSAETTRPPPKGKAWGTTLILCSRHGHKKSKAKAPTSGSVNDPWGNVGGPRRKITCDSPLVRILRWFVTLFDFLLIEWIFSLDSLSLSDSSSSFFLYFRTEREECRDTSECMQPDSTLH